MHAPAGADSAVARAHTTAVAAAAVASTLLAEPPDSSPYAHAGRTAVSSPTGPTRPHTAIPTPQSVPSTAGSRPGLLHGSDSASPVRVRSAGSPRYSTRRRMRRTRCSPAPRTRRGTRARARASAGTGSCIRGSAHCAVVPAAVGVGVSVVFAAVDVGVDFADFADSVDADAVVDPGAATAPAGAPAHMPISAPMTQAARVRAHVGAGASAPRGTRTALVLVPALGVRIRAARAMRPSAWGRGQMPSACPCPSLRSTATRAAAGAPPSASTRRGPHYGRPRPRSRYARAGRGVSPPARRRAAAAKTERQAPDRRSFVRFV